MKKKASKITYLFCGFSILSVILFAIIGGVNRPSDFKESTAYYYTPSMEWTIDDSATTTLPYSFKGDSDQSHVLTATLPDNLEDNMYLCVRSDQVNTIISIDGQIRTDYNTDSTRYFGIINPRRYLFVKTYAADSNKEISIKVTGCAADTGKVDITYYGDRTDILSQMISESAFDVIIAFVLFILCLICFIVGIITTIGMGTFFDAIHLSIMGMLASVWILCNAEISQLYFTNASMSTTIDYIMLMLLPFPFLFFMNSVQNHKYNIIYTAFQYIVIAEIIVCTALQLTNTLDYAQMFFGIAGVFGASLIMILITTAIDIFKDHNYSYLIIALGILAAIVATLIQIALFISGVISFGGKAVAVALIILLITAVIDSYRKVSRLEEQKRIAIAEGKAESTFLANMSHEIRTPINAVLGMNEMILRETKEENIREYASNIEGSGNMLLSLVNDILDFSKIRSGKMKIISDNYNLSKTIKTITEMMKPRASAKNLDYKVSIAPDLYNNLIGDEVRIKQIIINLITNAIKYTEQGFVSVSYYSKNIDDENITLCISVADSGKGIKEEDQPHLFDAFSRADEKNNRNIEGTGLGLALVSNLVYSMGGTISVFSKYGEGSTFVAEFPQKISDKMLISEAKAETKGAQKPDKSDDVALFTAPEASILVVDDIKMNLMVVKGLLKRTKVKTTLAESGQACLDLLSKEHFDVVLIDHLMPSMDGEETLKRIKENNLAPGSAIIVLTANAIDGVRDKYLAMGFDNYLSKPVVPADLEAMLLEYLPANKISK